MICPQCHELMWVESDTESEGEQWWICGCGYCEEVESIDRSTDDTEVDDDEGVQSYFPTEYG